MKKLFLILTLILVSVTSCIQIDPLDTQYVIFYIQNNTNEELNITVIYKNNIYYPSDGELTCKIAPMTKYEISQLNGEDCEITSLLIRNQDDLLIRELSIEDIVYEDGIYCGDTHDIPTHTIIITPELLYGESPEQE